MRRSSVVVMIVGSAIFAGGCTHPRTEVMVGFLSDFVIPQDLPQGKEFSIRFSANTGAVPSSKPACRCITAEADLPGSVGLFSADAVEAPMDLTLDAYQIDGHCDPGCDVTAPVFATRSANVTLLGSQTLFYRMALVASCKGKTCAAGETCREGTCRPRAVDPHALLPYVSTAVPKMEASLQCDSGTKFVDTGSGAPVPRANPFGCLNDQDCIEGTCYRHLSTTGGGADAGICSGAGGRCDELSRCCAGLACSSPDGIIPGQCYHFVPSDMTGLGNADASTGDMAPGCVPIASVTLVNQTTPMVDLFGTNGTRLAADAQGNIFVASSFGFNRGQIDKVAGATHIVTTLESSVWTNAIAVDAKGNLYYADYLNEDVYVAKGGQGPGTKLPLAANSCLGTTSQYVALAADGDGNVYVAQPDDSTVCKLVPPANGTGPWTVSTLAGAKRMTGWKDGTGTQVLFNYPVALAASGGGNGITIYVSDGGNHAIRKIDRLGVTTTLAGGVAGMAPAPGSADGAGATARFESPRDLVLDESGAYLYVAQGSSTIRKVATADGTTATAFDLNCANIITHGAGITRVGKQLFVTVTQGALGLYSITLP